MVLGTALGLVFVAIGLVGVVWPARVARVQEQLDAIGSDRSWLDVRPAGWRVTLTRVMGGVLVAVGLGIVLAG